MLRLPELVGSPLSLNALREDLQVAHRTVAGWMAILERLYAVFRLAPFGAPRIRAVRKEQKHYHLDWTVVPGQPQRFENLKQRFPEADAWQVSAVGRRDYRTPEGIRVAPAVALLRRLV